MPVPPFGSFHVRKGLTYPQAATITPSLNIQPKHLSLLASSTLSSCLPLLISLLSLRLYYFAASFIPMPEPKNGRNGVLENGPHENWRSLETASEFSRNESSLRSKRSLSPPVELKLDISDKDTLPKDEAVSPSTASHSTKPDLERGLQVQSTDQIPPLPAKRQSKFVRGIRHTYFTVYRRLFSIVFLLNLIALVTVLVKMGLHKLPATDMATASSANFLVAILIRQDYIANLLYQTAWLVPRNAPLRLRRLVAKVYEHGGVHSGAAISGTMWFILTTVTITDNFPRREIRSAALLTITYLIQVQLILIVVFAYPTLRSKKHNAFELMHRFGGWFTVELFWVELIFLCRAIGGDTGATTGSIILEQPTFWFLIIITFHIILPWLRLRQWEFAPEVLSDHALRLHFSHHVPQFSGLAISESPLFEWHQFATFPAPQGRIGGSMIISAAGDWTNRTVRNPKQKYWVKGLPKFGVLSMASIFQRVVVVTTGSGIGPTMSFLIDRPTDQACRLIWSTTTPVKTFGQTLNDWVLEVNPNAVIINTRETGRPDLVRMTYELYRECNAEAVFVISNPKLTRKLVYGMESRGIPAYGPIWDS